MYLPSKSQRRRMRAWANEAERLNKTGAARVGTLIDGPNVYHSAKSLGEAVRPDFKGILEIARSYGVVEQAMLLVNPGTRINERFLYDFELVRGTDRDCDHLLSSCAVATLAAGVDVLVLVSGDHRFVDIGRLCGRLGVLFIVVGMPEATSHLLMNSFPFHPLPTIHIQPVAGQIPNTQAITVTIPSGSPNPELSNNSGGDL